MRGPRSLLIPFLALALAGCSNAPDGRPEAAGSAPATAQKARKAKPAALPGTPVDLTGLEGRSVQELEKLHRQAIADGRLAAPALDNAVYYELALRERGDRQAFQRLLDEFAPSLVLEAEAAIVRGDEAETARYIALLQAVDPNHPALPRLRAGNVPAGIPSRPSPETQVVVGADGVATLPAVELPVPAGAIEQGPGAP